MNISQLYDYLFKLPSNDRGKAFELYSKWFLENDPIYHAQLKKVWLWKDWPLNWGRDKGIDLIGETHTGEFWAIQAKCYDDSYYITKEDVDKFLSESSRAAISYRLLISTTDRMGDNAREVVAAQEKQVGICSLQHLLDSSLNWPSSVEDLKPLPIRKPKTPRLHQENAIASVLEGFKIHDKGQLYMACGTGKTLVGLWIAEGLKSQNTLVLVPSISLVSQLYQEWAANANTNFIPIFVCSDPTVGEKDQMVTSLYELGFPTTTNPHTILNYFSSTTSTPKVIFSTYHSSPVIKELCSLDKNLTFDITIADEAHRCAGTANSDFAILFEMDAIRTRRKLFMTATPKIFSNHVKTKAQELEYSLLSMDDEERFGPVFHKLPFSKAIAQDLLSDYEVLISIMDDKTYQEYAEKGRFVAINRHESDARTIATQILISKAIKSFDLRRLITFHNRKSAADDFISSFPIALDLISESQRPTVGFYGMILGDMLQSKRKLILKLFENVESDSSAVLANVRCLSEGVDVPSLDGVAFIDPKGSEIEIIQAVGRAIRKAPNKKRGLIILPIFIDPDGDPEINLEDSCFKPIWKVLNALRAHDDILAEELDHLRLELGRRTYKKPPKLNKIAIDLPVSIDSHFSDALRLKIIDRYSAANKIPISQEDLILWIQKYIEKYKKKPVRTSGIIEFATGELQGSTWRNVDVALIEGLRGFPKKYTLASFIKEHFGIKPRKANSTHLTEELIFSWVTQFMAKHERKPSPKKDGIIEFATGEHQGETWVSVSAALRNGGRGLPGGLSLSSFIEMRLGIKKQKCNSTILSEDLICSWIEKYIAKHGKKPTQQSGIIEFADKEYEGDTWLGISAALRNGGRSLPGGSSLAKLIEKRFEIKRQEYGPSLTEKAILDLVKAYIAKYGKKPNCKTGSVEGQNNLTWSAINRRLEIGDSILPGGYSLARLIEDKLSIRDSNRPPSPFSLELAKDWIKQYLKKYRKRPLVSNSAKVEFASGIHKGISWGSINRAFLRGECSLPKGTTLGNVVSMVDEKI